MPSEVTTNLQDQLEEIVGAGHLDWQPETLAAFGVDGVMPILVVHPGTQEEVSKVVAACAATGTPMLPWGGGTAVGQGNAPSAAPVVIGLDRLDRVVEFDPENLCVTVEAGMPLARLQELVATKQELLPLDPPEAERATLGGLVAADQSGPSRLLHGTARDWVLGLRVVLPDGERIRCGGRVIKNVSGYDMNKLFIRSFGTLGILTEVTVKLLPMPEARASVLGVFQDLPLAAAVVEKVLASYLLPEAMDLLDPAAQRRLSPDLGLGAQGSYILAVGLAGSQATVDRQIRDLQALINEGGGRAILHRAADSIRAWAALTNVLGSSASEPGRVGCRLAVPIGWTARMMATLHQCAARHGVVPTVAAHAGSGILRASLQAPSGLPPEAALSGLVATLESLRKEATGIGGSLVLEEAPVPVKQRVDAWGLPGSSFGVMRRIKQEFDPLSLCSPGRFLGGL